MSSSTISRWNAIPMERTQAKPTDDFDDGGSGNEDPDTKPQYLRDLEGDQSDEDNVSIVSRSPSPKPQDVVIDPLDPRSFREHFGARHEAVNVNTRISSSNKGFALLAKMGWKEGTGLGLSEDARIDPIPFVLKSDSTGIGKAAMDARIIEATVAQRRDLDSERQMKESDDQRQLRLNAAAQKETVKTEISQVLRPFYCEICDKQYTNVGQFDEHCNSYAHHHRKREKDLKAAERAKNANAGEADARKEKERLREQKELRKMAKAAGVKLPAVASSSTPLAPVAPAVAPTVPPGQSKPSGFKKVGWASVSAGAEPSAAGGLDATTASLTPPAPAIQSTGGFKRTGWATAGSTLPVVSATTGVSEQSLATSGLSSGPVSLDPPAGGFKRSGWSNIGSTVLTAASTPTNVETVAAPVSGFKKLGISFTSPSLANTAQLSSSQAPLTTAPLGSSSMTAPAPAAGLITDPDSSSAPPAAAPRKGNAERSRSNWSSFNRGAPPAAIAASPQASGGRGDSSSTAVVSTSGPPSARRRSRSRSRSRSPPPARRGRSRSRSPPGRRRSRSRSASRSPGRARRRSRSRSWSRSRSRSPAPRHRLPGADGQRAGGRSGGGGSGWNNDRGGARDYRPHDAASRSGGGYSSGRSYSHGYR